MSNLAGAERRRQARELNAMIDACLLSPRAHPPRALATRLPPLGAAVLAERVRRRATLISRRERPHADAILGARDTLILALYARAVPRGAFTAWSDGSVRKGPAGPAAGIGSLLMHPEGRILARLSRAGPWRDAFSAEIAALVAMMGAAAEHGAGRSRVCTDCVALLRLWLERRDEPRLEQVRERARRFRRSDLRAPPRAHNQPANRLAREAMAGAAGREHEVSYTPQRALPGPAP